MGMAGNQRPPQVAAQMPQRAGRQGGMGQAQQYDAFRKQQQATNAASQAAMNQFGGGQYGGGYNMPPSPQGMGRIGPQQGIGQPFDLSGFLNGTGGSIPAEFRNNMTPEQLAQQNAHEQMQRNLTLQNQQSMPPLPQGGGGGGQFGGGQFGGGYNMPPPQRGYQSQPPVPNNKEYYNGDDPALRVQANQEMQRDAELMRQWRANNPPEALAAQAAQARTLNQQSKMQDSLADRAGPQGGLNQFGGSPYGQMVPQQGMPYGMPPSPPGMGQIDPNRLPQVAQAAQGGMGGKGGQPPSPQQLGQGLERQAAMNRAMGKGSQPPAPQNFGGNNQFGGQRGGFNNFNNRFDNYGGGMGQRGFRR